MADKPGWNATFELMRKYFVGGVMDRDRQCDLEGRIRTAFGSEEQQEMQSGVRELNHLSKFEEHDVHEAGGEVRRSPRRVAVGHCRFKSRPGHMGIATGFASVRIETVTLASLEASGLEAGHA